MTDHQHQMMLKDTSNTTGKTSTKSDKETTKVIKTQGELIAAMAGMGGLPYELREIEVSPELFLFLTAHQKTPYLTYGNPAFRIYQAGTMEQIKQDEANSKC